jgi:hypothetical protein
MVAVHCRLPLLVLIWLWYTSVLVVLGLVFVILMGVFHQMIHANPVPEEGTIGYALYEFVHSEHGFQSFNCDSCAVSDLLFILLVFFVVLAWVLRLYYLYVVWTFYKASRGGSARREKRSSGHGADARPSPASPPAPTALLAAATPQSASGSGTRRSAAKSRVKRGGRAASAKQFARTQVGAPSRSADGSGTPRSTSKVDKGHVVSAKKVPVGGATAAPQPANGDRTPTVVAHHGGSSEAR